MFHLYECVCVYIYDMFLYNVVSYIHILSSPSNQNNHPIYQIWAFSEIDHPQALSHIFFSRQIIVKSDTSDCMWKRPSFQINLWLTPAPHTQKKWISASNKHQKESKKSRKIIPRVLVWCGFCPIFSQKICVFSGGRLYYQSKQCNITSREIRNPANLPYYQTFGINFDSQKKLGSI